ncbi:MULTISPECIES: 3-oxoacyl-ACP synthase III family protein [unclassified Carboxylicivirga]|uniref:3-oxoacyl-ACP synthase III family protein n=1 Tax=Carboxylicivirga TaxID=1628153 RepID=UPI003D32EDBC
MKKLDRKITLSDAPVVVPQIPVGIYGVGAYLPPMILGNDDFRQLRLSAAEKIFIDQIAGVKNRHYSADEDINDMAVKAAMDALQHSETDAANVDLVLVTGVSKDMSRLTPPNSTLIQTKIGAAQAAAMNIDQGFAGMIYTLSVAASFIASGFYQTVLVVASETILKNTPGDNMKALLVGEGAGAFLLKRADVGFGIQGFHLSSWEVDDEAGYVKVMGGCNSLFDKGYGIKPFFTVGEGSFEKHKARTEKYIPQSVKKVLKHLGHEAQNYDLFVFGQKFKGLSEAWARNIGIDYDRVHDTIATTACLETASIPVIIKDAIGKGRLNKGDYLMLSDFGSNWAVASLAMRWCI